MNKKVSCIVPIYNVENYLQDCIESLAKQTYSNLEVLLIDDGSKDNSSQIAIDASRKYRHFSYYRKQNGGLSDARNFGLNYAKGEYICFVDSDDWVASDYVSKLVTVLQTDDASIAICDMEYHYDSGRVVYASGGDIKNGNVIDHPELITINNSACNKLFKKEIIEQFIFPFGLAYEDLATIPVSIALAKKIAKVNEPLYFYRQREGSIAHTANKKIFDIYKAIDRCVNYFNTYGYSDYANQMKSLYIIHGLDLTTLRIKDFDNKTLINDYFKENMSLLRQYYPEYKKDPLIKQYDLKKRLIFNLLDKGYYNFVKRLYGKN